MKLHPQQIARLIADEIFSSAECGVEEFVDQVADYRSEKAPAEKWAEFEEGHPAGLMLNVTTRNGVIVVEDTDRKLHVFRLSLERLA